MNGPPGPGLPIGQVARRILPSRPAWQIVIASRNLDFHSLRHTCGDWMRRQGVSMKLIQRVLRHGSERLTADLYADHVDAAELAEAVEQLPALRATGTDDIPF